MARCTCIFTCRNTSKSSDLSPRPLNMFSLQYDKSKFLFTSELLYQFEVIQANKCSALSIKLFIEQIVNSFLQSSKLFSSYCLRQLKKQKMVNKTGNTKQHPALQVFESEKLCSDLSDLKTDFSV